MNNNTLDNKAVVSGERIKEVREENGLTQESFASKIANAPGSSRAKCTSVQIGYMERGDRPVSAVYAHLIAELFGVRAEWIMGKDDYKTEDDYISAAKSFSEFDSFQSSVEGFFHFLGLDCSVWFNGNLRELQTDDLTHQYSVIMRSGTLGTTFSLQEVEEIKQDLRRIVLGRIAEKMSKEG